MPAEYKLLENPNKPHIIRPKLFVVQNTIDKTERWRTAHRFGEMSPATLTSLLQKVGEQGYLYEWGDFCEYMLETDTPLASCLDTRIQRIVQAPSKIVPGKSVDPKRAEYAEPAARFVSDVLDGIDRWDEWMSSMLHAIGVGVSAHEKIWTWDQGIGAYVIDRRGFRWCHPHRLQFGEAWDVRLYDEGRKGSGTWGEELKKDNWVIHIAANRGTYPGKAGVLRYCAWPWLFKLWFRKFHAHAVETFGQPFVHGEVPNTASEGVIEEMKTKLESLSYDTVAVFREGTRVLFETAGNIGTGEIFDRAIKMCDDAQTKLILGAEDIVTPGTHGSQSAVESRVETTLDPRTISDGKRFAADLKEYLFEPLCRLNTQLFGGVIPAIPGMVFGGDAREDVMVPEVQGEGEQSGETVAPEQIESAIRSALTPQQQAAVLDVAEKAFTGRISRQAGVEYLTTFFSLDRSFAEKLISEPTTPPPTPPPALTATAANTALEQQIPPPKAKKARAGGRPATRSRQAATTQTSLRFRSPIAKRLLGE